MAGGGKRFRARRFYSARYAATAWARKMPTLSNAITAITNSTMELTKKTNSTPAN
jgi:hypothetical protein